MLVNTASDCGYTDQYDDLQKLYEKYKDKLVVIGFPANDFKEQEKGTDEEIAAVLQTKLWDQLSVDEKKFGDQKRANKMQFLNG